MKTAKNEAVHYWETKEVGVDPRSVVQELLWEYAQANGTHRLHLWLTYRDLRREFDAVAELWKVRIGTEPSRTELIGNPALRSLRRWIGRLMRMPGVRQSSAGPRTICPKKPGSPGTLSANSRQLKHDLRRMKKGGKNLAKLKNIFG